LEKCFERTRSAGPDRADVGGAAVTVLRDATAVDFDDLAVDVFDVGLDPFLELLTDTVFRGFVLRRIDLTTEDAAREAFLGDLDFDFAFVAINAATYTGNTS
jgi:hypothetical protein